MAFGCKLMNNVNICSHQVTINKALQSFNLLIRIPESLIFKAVQTEARQPSLPGTQSPASEGAPDSVRDLRQSASLYLSCLGNKMGITDLRHLTGVGWSEINVRQKLSR